MVTKKKYVPKTAEQKQQEVDELFKVLDEGVANLQLDPEKLKALLAMSALMPSYSFRNMLLILSQLPQASYVASFKEWKEFNRFVKKGEKAIRILAPRLKQVENEETGEKETICIGFIPVPVFDVSQTDGEPLPIEKFKLTLEGESEEANRILKLVKSLATEDECKFEFGDTGNANGYYSPADHRIRVCSTLSGNHKAKTAVHEFVHSRVHRKGTDGTTAEERECVAEGTAFIICSYFGLDTSSYSFEYVKGWSKEDGALLKYGSTIQKSAKVIIDDIERIMSEEEETQIVESVKDVSIA